MTKRVQRYGLTSAAMAALTGLAREIIVNTTDFSLHVHDGVTAGGFKISTDTLNAAAYQPKSAALTGLAGVSSNGVIARTAANTYSARTITGTAAEITVTNGDGVAGNPTLSLPAALTFTGKTITGGTFATPTITAPAISGAATIAAGSTITTPIFATSMKLPFSVDHGGRVTLVTAIPYMLSDQTAKGTVFFTPARHNMMVGYDGSNIVAQPFSEVSLILNATDNLSGNIHDIWYDFVGAQLGTGPTWTTVTAGSSARGTGAGTTEVEVFNGMYVNKNSITLRANGASLGAKAARTCVLVGTAYMTANGQTGVAFKPAAAAGGSNTIIGLCNAINTRPISARSIDSTATWTYAIATWRAMNGSNSNRITYVDCLGQIFCKARALASVGATSTTGMIGVSFNSTSATPATISQVTEGGTDSVAVTIPAEEINIGLGLNYAQAQDFSASGTETYTRGSLFADLEM